MTQATFLARLNGFAADLRGVAALELALLAPTLLLLLLGIFDFGQMTYTVMEVRAAAHAGAQYVYANPSNCTVSGVSSAVTGATTLTVQASPSPVCGSYYCATNGALVASTSGATCPSGELAGTYATISAKANFSPIAPWSGLIFPSTLSASSTIRYQ